MTPEKIASYLLEDETRTLTLTSGTRVPVTVFRLYWEYFDELIANGSFTESRLITHIEKTMETKPYTLPESFVSMVGYIYTNIGNGSVGIEAMRTIKKN